LIGALIFSEAYDSPANAAIRLLWTKLPSELRNELRNYAATAVQRPSRGLIERLVRAINDLAEQHCLCLDLAGALKECDAAGQPNTRDIPTKEEIDRALSATLRGFIAEQYTTRSTPLFANHNAIEFYTWDGRECCLPVGSTRATVRDDRFGGEAAADSCSRDSLPSILGGVAKSLVRSSVARYGGLSPFVQRHLYGAWNLSNLAAGQTILLEEIRGPQTHQGSDADPTHRQFVKLTHVDCTIDPVAETRIVEIQWRPEDALRFPLCLSSRGPFEEGCRVRGGISVARGNVLLADHGRTLDEWEWLGATDYRGETPRCEDDPEPVELEPVRSKLLRPVLKEPDLTFASVPVNSPSATGALTQKPDDALPWLEVYGFPVASREFDVDRDPGTPPRPLISFSDLESPEDLLARFSRLPLEDQRRLEDFLPPASARDLQEHNPADKAEAGKIGELRCALHESVEWTPTTDFLSSAEEDQRVVVEMDDERRPHLRFGDGELGRRPPNHMSYYARYRQGNGQAGNVGAERIKHIVYRRQAVSGISRVRNPLPAQGGVEPESAAHAKLHAPSNFQQPTRAIIADDYRELVKSSFGDRIQQAVATLSWMGAWFEVDVSVDPKADQPDIKGLLQEIEAYLYPRRRIGHLLRVSLPQYVSLEVDMTVCVRSGFLRAHVRQELLELFSSRVRANGELGFFHPDNFTFGSELALSRIIAAAKTIEGVENVDVTRFERRGRGDAGEWAAGVMRFGPLEIPRLDNDPVRPEFGRLTLDVRGLR
jgi:hypothetical protein